MHEGPPMHRRWPVAVVAFGFAVIAYTTAYNQSTSPLDLAIWWIASAGISAVSVAFFLFGTRELRRLSAAAIIPYGILRAGAYALDGVYTPAGVWLVVVGLVLAAYFSQVRHEAHGTL